jgi:hypothetical protein
MILRIAAALSLALGTIALLGFLTIAGRGPLASSEARHLSALKNRRVPPAQAVPITFADLGALPHGRPLAEYAPLEERGVALEGYVQGMLSASDGDVHLEVGDTEVPRSWPNYLYTTAEITAPWRQDSPTWQYERLVANFRPVGSGYRQWDRPARRVRLTGWLLYDFQYDTPTTATIGRLTGWEIHPVTRIELWDEARQEFVEYRR